MAAARGAVGERGPARAGALGQPRARDRRAVRRWWRGDRPRHVRRRALLPRGAARGGRRQRDDARAARRRGAVGFCGVRPRDITPSGAGDGLLPVQQRRRRRRLAIAELGLGACWSSTGTSTTATAPRRSSAAARTCCSRASTSAAVPGHRRPRATRRRGGRGLHDQPARAAAAPARRSGCGCSTASCCPRRSRSSPSWCSSRPASTRTARTRSPAACCRRRSFVRDGRRCAGWRRAAGIPLGVVLEGGYNRAVLAECVCALRWRRCAEPRRRCAPGRAARARQRSRAPVATRSPSRALLAV